MNRKLLLSIAAVSIIGVSLPLGAYLYLRSQVAAKPSWLRSGMFMTYEQFFVWTGHNQTENMTWNVVGLRDDFVDVHLVSHGADATGENVAITLGEENWTINVFTREIVDSLESAYVGKKVPFWIENSTRIGSRIDSFYGVSVVKQSQVISVLGQQRDCWVVEYDWTTATMTRWYDKSSGIVLKIHVVLHQNTTVDITETAISTNIDL
jgi:hypothetical protein